MIFNIKGFIKFLVNNTLTNLKPKLFKFSYKLRTNYYIIKYYPIESKEKVKLRIFTYKKVSID
ncbi:hypothetical protein HMPREF9078_01876 [Capnocytophaga sp. oral taxon 380 str. F0488]|nr:hypothetical protein HMPREF9078_01876 [Capnocytophaga sp. oral taxon 380 str. F0488]